MGSVPIDSVALGLIASRFAHFGALALLFGALLFPVYAYRGAARVQALGQRPGPVAAAIVAILSGLAWYMFTSANMAGSLSAAWDPSTLADVGDTDFGRLWLGRMAVLLVVLVLLLQRSRPAWLLALAVSAGALGSLAWTGHANADDGQIGILHKSADVAHLLTAGLWLGALPALAARLQHPDQADDVSAFDVVSRFSRVAMPAVALLIASGLANAALIMSSPWDLAATDYGRWLCLKLALVGVMLALAAINRQRLTPALQAAGSTSTARRLRRHCYTELGLGFGVLAVVAILGMTSPS